MITVTVDDIMSKRPCFAYPRSRIEELWAGRERLTPTDICDLSIPISAIIWAVTHFLLDRSNRLFACDCAESVLPIWTSPYPGDNRPAEAIRIARLYADGRASDETLRLARGAAWDAARDAASAASWGNVEVAVAEAASGAARDADCDAGWAARQTSDSAYCAARGSTNAEMVKQLQFLRKYCEEA